MIRCTTTASDHHRDHYKLSHVPQSPLHANTMPIPDDNLMWAFHGTSEAAAACIGYSATGHRGGLVDDFDLKPAIGNGNLLGRGVYLSPTYEKARAYGDHVYLIGFEVDSLKITTSWDQKSQWRRPREPYNANAYRNRNADAVYMPSTYNGGQEDHDQFCVRGSKIMKVYLIRQPSDSYWGCSDKPYNCHVAKADSLRCLLRVILDSLEDPETAYLHDISVDHDLDDSISISYTHHDADGDYASHCWNDA